MALAVVTGNALSDRQVGELTGLGYRVLNGSDAVLEHLGASDRGRELKAPELGESLIEAEIYVYGGLERASRAALQGAESLKLITFLGTGWSDPGCVDPDAAKDLRIRVSNTPHANSWSTAEMTVALILALERQIFPMDQTMRQGEMLSIRRRDVAGLRIGVVGLGHVGGAVARILASGFGCAVSYSGPTAKSALEEDLGAQRMPLDELIATSDVVTIHTPGNETLGLVGPELVASMKAGSILVNTATPGIVDGNALVSALESGQIFGLGIDGMYDDDSISERLYALGARVIATPRAAWLTSDSYERMGSMALESIRDLLDGVRPIRHQVLGLPDD